MLPAAHRLRRPEEFRAVLRGRHGAPRSSRARSGGDLMVLHLARRPAPGDPSTGPREHARVGFVVSKAVGNSVVRHRTVRRLRHLVADRLSTLPDDLDLVIRAQPAAATADTATLAAELDRHLQRCLARTGGARP